MQAYAIVGNTNNINKEAIEFAKTIANDIYEEEIYKIDDLRKLIKDISLSYSKKTAIILQNFDMASVETQNALLKKLEEPQSNLYLIITAKSEHNLLPTIVSRIKTIRSKQKEISKKSDFFDLSTSDKFSKTLEIKKREDAIIFIENLLKQSRKEDNYTKHLPVLEIVYRNLQANGNPGIQLTYLISQMDSS